MNEDKAISPSEDPVLLERADGIAWVTLNRPAKRNAISPPLVYRMVEVLAELESDDSVKVVVLTGAGNAFSAGMDLRDYFRATDGKPAEQMKLFRANALWQWKQLRFFAKPTIAMVNGYCFGGAFTPLISCDLAIASDDATFGLSEINWGIIPAGVVNRAVAQVMNERDAMYYVMTGEPFDGRKAARMGLVNESVPADQLRARVIELADILKKKNPTVLRTAKIAYRHAEDMSWEQANDYLMAKYDQAILHDPEKGRATAMSQFLDQKTFRPGLETYAR
ncbi:p-hydroxycinnamoyl CoA hydratase/lyase [Hydrogenophaga laconesensis]|uniref:Trans-feruloyl-CoA hydratase/vanillin synthase n=1 Tax=Hydrogenophaga laconesensis TaxID=1805971 RepID=A0ABU1VAU5_9BURK|nr:p-hydroxycinnamoyl CoA hydratase/lyase [Hydrogenophaga laconesensis]MDR7094596.1 trans-feruloyl-CoA hydratase/vanillin synthase [Hydrogenophaga laconesensis]